MDTAGGWEERVTRLWSEIDERDGPAFVNRMQALVDELPPNSAIASFELGAAFDSTGHPQRAIPLYREALDCGLDGIRRRRAVIQMASSVRNLGDAASAVDMLRAERERGHDELDEAVIAFLALALADLGHEREALALSLDALSRCLPRYNRSLSRYAAALLA